MFPFFFSSSPDDLDDIFFRFFPNVSDFFCRPFIRTSIYEVTRLFLKLLLRLKSQKSAPSDCIELACCRQASTTAQHRQSAMHKAAKHVRTDQSTTTQASRQSWREPACRRAFMIRLAVFSKRAKKSISVSPAIY